MRIIKKTYKVYSFDELSDEVKEKVVEKMYDINVNHDGWHDWLLEEWQDKLEKLGYDDAKIFYRGFCSQGDGACFEARVEVVTYILAHKLGRKYRALYNFYKNTSNRDITIEHIGCYYHERSMTVNADTPAVEYHSDNVKVQNKILEQFDALVALIEDDIIEVAKEIYKELEKEYYSLIEKDEVIETIKENEYEFLENGQLFD